MSLVHTSSKAGVERNTNVKIVILVTVSRWETTTHKPDANIPKKEGCAACWPLGPPAQWKQISYSVCALYNGLENINN